MNAVILVSLILIANVISSSDSLDFKMLISQTIRPNVISKSIKF